MSTIQEAPAHAEAKRRTVIVFVNEKPVVFHQREATGAQIKAAAIEQGVAIQQDFALFLVKGHARPDQVRAVVEEQAQSYERPEEVVRWFYAAPERLRDIESLVMEENTVAWALGVAKVQDEAFNFDELMGNK